jgi:cyclin B
MSFYNFRSTNQVRKPLADKTNARAGAPFGGPVKRGAAALGAGAAATLSTANRRTTRSVANDGGVTAKRTRDASADDESDTLHTKKMSLEPMELEYDDIDLFDTEDAQCAVEYVQDIFAYLRAKEITESVEPTYMDNQVDVNKNMRGVLIDWMVEVCQKFRLLSETMFLSVHIVDKYMSTQQVPRQRLQLVGITAMLVASKVEEICTPLVSDFVYVCDYSFSAEQILSLEVDMLTALGFNLTPATPLHFVRRFSKAARSDSRTHTLSKYITELALIEYAMLQFKPSLIAAAAVYIARAMVGRTPLWNDTLRYYTHFNESDLFDCVRTLNALVNKQFASNNKLQAIRNKYASSKLLSVAQIPAKPELPM